MAAIAGPRTVTNQPAFRINLRSTPGALVGGIVPVQRTATGYHAAPLTTANVQSYLRLCRAEGWGQPVGKLTTFSYQAPVQQPSGIRGVAQRAYGPGLSVEVDDSASTISMEWTNGPAEVSQVMHIRRQWDVEPGWQPPANDGFEDARLWYRSTRLALQFDLQSVDLSATPEARAAYSRFLAEQTMARIVEIFAPADTTGRRLAADELLTLCIAQGWISVNEGKHGQTFAFDGDWENVEYRLEELPGIKLAPGMAGLIMGLSNGALFPNPGIVSAALMIENADASLAEEGLAGEDTHVPPGFVDLIRQHFGADPQASNFIDFGDPE